MQTATENAGPRTNRWKTAFLTLLSLVMVSALGLALLLPFHRIVESDLVWQLRRCKQDLADPALCGDRDASIKALASLLVGRVTREEVEGKMNSAHSNGAFSSVEMSTNYVELNGLRLNFDANGKLTSVGTKE